MRYELAREDATGRTRVALHVTPVPGDVLELSHGPNFTGRFEVVRREIGPAHDDPLLILRAAAR